MILAAKIRFNRYLSAALPLVALLTLTGCGNDSGGTGTGGAGGSGAAGGSGGAGGAGGAGGSGGPAGAGGSSAAGGSGGSGGSSGTGGSDAGDGSGIYGTFTVSVLEEPPPPYTKLLGQIYNGPQPITPVLKLDSEEGGCQLLVPKNPFCMGGCAGGVCIDENQCQPYPQTVNVGIAQVTGFKTGPFTITPTTPGNVYQPTPTLPARACDEGGALEIKTDRFTLQGKCVAPLDVVAKTTDKIPVKTGMPVRIQWSAPAQMGASRMEIHLDISHHGGAKGEINCDVPDTGSFDIPLTLSNKLISLGLAGFPTVDIKRVSSAKAANEPHVQIRVTSDVTRDVDTGVISCNDDSNCPPGQTCQRDLTCK